MPIHRLHHEFDRPHVLTLFVVHPIETFGFGLLWLAVLLVYPSSWLGIALYVTINLAAGVLGHLGVEPFPRWWTRIPVARHIGTSTFHAQHHQDVHHNFGFYTVVWDRLLGTLSTEYDRSFRSTQSQESVIHGR
jgi:sterol desaturase/sphingolipid hydroxylase (fatty acid hydroxylase superfamily)